MVNPRVGVMEKRHRAYLIQCLFLEDRILGQELWKNDIGQI